MIRRKSHGTMTVDARIDIDDILDSIESDDLIEVLKERGDCLKVDVTAEVIGQNEAEDILALLKRGNVDDAILMIERLAFPKFETPEKMLAHVRKTCPVLLEGTQS